MGNLRVTQTIGNILFSVQKIRSFFSPTRPYEFISVPITIIQLSKLIDFLKHDRRPIAFEYVFHNRLIMLSNKYLYNYHYYISMNIIWNKLSIIDVHLFLIDLVLYVYMLNILIIYYYQFNIIVDLNFVNTHKCLV